MTSLRDWLEEATTEAAAGRVDRAVAAYRQAIALAPARGDLRYNLGVLLFGQDEFAAAERAFVEAQRLRPDWPALPLALGHLCYRQHRYAEAEVHFERAVALAPASVEALGNLALALSARWRYDLALPCLQRARALAPADEDVWFALRGVLLALDRDDDALQDFLVFERQAKPSARFVATDAEYVAIACRLATDPAWRAKVGAAIRRQFATVPLADPRHYARCLEDALQRAVAAKTGATS